MADRAEFSPGDIGFLKADETGSILRGLQACQEIKKFWAETREKYRRDEGYEPALICTSGELLEDDI